MRPKVTALMLHEAAVQKAPKFYVATAFRGVGQYSTVKGSFDEVYEKARSMYTDRPVAIYAVNEIHQSHVVNYEPKKELKMAYMITWRESYRDPKIVRYTEKGLAVAALEAITDPAVAGMVVEIPSDIQEPNTTIATLFNALKAADVAAIKKFHTKGEGQQRTFDRIQELAKDTPVLSVAVNVNQTSEEADLAIKKTAKKKTAANGNGVKRVKVDQDAKITVLAEENPKRKGTAAHDMFKLYRNGMLVSTFIEKGGSAMAIKYDAAHGFIKLS